MRLRASAALRSPERRSIFDFSTLRPLKIRPFAPSTTLQS